MELDPNRLVSEIALLKERLDEVETLRGAIERGEVDAFVVGTAEENKRVLLLSGAYTRYRQLVEDMRQGAFTLSSSGEIVFANFAFAAMLGRSPLDLFRTSIVQHLAPDERDKAAALASPRPGAAAVETAMMRRDARIPVRLSLVSSSEEFITYIVTDLSDHAYADDAEATVEAIRNGHVDALVVGGEQVVMLDSAQRLFQIAVDRMQQGAAMISADRSIGYANDRFITMTGAPRARIHGSDITRYIDDADRSKLVKALEACTTSASQAEVRIARPNGSTLSVMVTLFSLADGRCMCLFADTTEHRRHLEADERNRKFLGMLAHEMRNMLGPVRNSVRLLKLAQLEPQCLEAVEMIERQNERMLRLVEDLGRINPRD